MSAIVLSEYWISVDDIKVNHALEIYFAWHIIHRMLVIAGAWRRLSPLLNILALSQLILECKCWIVLLLSSWWILVGWLLTSLLGIWISSGEVVKFFLKVINRFQICIKIHVVFPNKVLIYVVLVLRHINALLRAANESIRVSCGVQIWLDILVVLVEFQGADNTVDSVRALSTLKEEGW